MKKYAKKGRHGTHSPFVYNFISTVLRGPSAQKSFLGKYFFPVTYIKDPSKIYLNFLEFYAADTLYFCSEFNESIRPEIANDVFRVLIIQKKGRLITQEVGVFLTMLQDRGVEYAIWTERMESDVPEEYFNRVIELQQCKIYFYHTSFKEREYFRLW